MGKSGENLTLGKCMWNIEVILGILSMLTTKVYSTSVYKFWGGSCTTWYNLWYLLQCWNFWILDVFWCIHRLFTTSRGAGCQLKQFCCNPSYILEYIISYLPLFVSERVQESPHAILWNYVFLCILSVIYPSFLRKFLNRGSCTPKPWIRHGNLIWQKDTWEKWS